MAGQRSEVIESASRSEADGIEFDWGLAVMSWQDSLIIEGAVDMRTPEGDGPTVVHVDQERDYRITVLAPDFETFVTGLVDESDYGADDGDA